MLKPLRHIFAVYLFASALPGFAAAAADSQPPVSFPLTFEANRGQTAPQVQYLARSREGLIFFTQNGLTVAVPHAGAFRMLFENAAAPQITPEQELVTRTNYLGRGGDQPIANVENYGAIRYSGLYPGIDVRFYGQSRHVEHDFVLAPGADPKQIVLRFEGIDHLALTKEGDAGFSLGELRLVETVPVASQTVNGAKKMVAAHWKLLGENELGIELGAYDRNLTVMIDPVLVYSTHLGGNAGEDPDLGSTFPADTAITHIGLDSSRNVYVAGFTSATDYPTTAGAFDRSSNLVCSFHSDCTSESGFVSKFDPTGRILIYSTFMRVSIDAMAVDSSGHVYTAEAQFDEDPGPAFGFDEGIHLDKLSQDGSHLLFTTIFAQTTSNAPSCQLNGASSSAGGLAVDNSGHAWLVGNTSNPCLPATPGAFQTTLPNTGNGTGFVAKFDTNKSPSTALVYATYLGGSSGLGTNAQAVTVDSTGDAYVAGSTDGNSFPHSHGFGSGQNAVFVAKLNAAGSGLVFGSLLHGGGNFFRGLGGIAIDSSHNVYVAGNQATSTFPTTTGAFRRTITGTNCTDFNSNPAPCDDAFITKLSASGGTLLYSTLLGGSGTDSITGLGLNNAGMAFVTGITNSTDFPTTANAFKKSLAGSPAGASNAFVTAMQPDGKSLYYSTLLGGSSSTQGGAIAIDPAWNAWVGGNTGDTDFPVTPDAFQPGMKGESDAFLAKVVIAADLKLAMTQSATLVSKGTIVGFTATVSNLGPDGSDAVVLTDAIPAGFSFSSISNSTASSCSVPAAGATSGSVICHKTRLEKGQSFGVKINLKAIAASGSHITNKVTVSARTQDLNKSNNAAQGTVAVK
jgi:uncharacterized repeat protein (TIGR01451 family)